MTPLERDAEAGADLLYGVVLRVAIGSFVAVVLVLALAWVVGCATWASSGSVYRSSGPCPVHIGIRPASDGVGDYAATVRIAGDPECRP